MNFVLYWLKLITDISHILRYLVWMIHWYYTCMESWKASYFTSCSHSFNQTSLPSLNFETIYTPHMPATLPLISNLPTLMLTRYPVIPPTWLITSPPKLSLPLNSLASSRVSGFPPTLFIQFCLVADVAAVL